MQGGRKPLEGHTILITRDRLHSGRLVTAIEAYGGEVVLFPVLSFAEPETWVPCDEALRGIDRYNAIAFTSANAVSGFCRRADSLGVRLPPSDLLRVFAVGEKTAAALKEHGIGMDAVPPRFSAQSLGNLIAADSVRGWRFLLPQGDIARQELRERLEELGALVDTVVVYRTVEVTPPGTEAVVTRLRAGEIDVVTFASPSAVRGFLRATGNADLFREGEKPIIAVIGPTTAAAVRSAGLPLAVEAAVSTMPGLAGAIADFFLQTEK